MGHVTLWGYGAWAHKQPALIYVRDIPPNEHNPFTTEQTVLLIQAALDDMANNIEMRSFSDLPHLATDVEDEQRDLLTAISASEILVGPDIAAIRYGRGVGYLVEEIELSKDVQGISATEIRKKIKTGLPGWRDFVLPSVGNLLLEMDW